MIRAAFGCRSVVGRNAYHLGHVEPILAKSALMVVGQNVVMLLALLLAKYNTWSTRVQNK